jgi:hypothetical protein
MWWRGWRSIRSGHPTVVVVVVIMATTVIAVAASSSRVQRWKGVETVEKVAIEKVE